jgi:hypothetical protein
VKYRCRTTVPKRSPWKEIEAETPLEALQEFHAREVPSGYAGFCHRVEEDGRMHKVYFALIEVEGHEPVISRIYQYGIWRKGAVRSAPPTLREIAKALGWAHPPSELLDEDWEGEETMEEAGKARYGT